MWACLHENYQIVNLLIDSGADINIRGQYGETALLVALRKADFKTARLLIEKGADINTQNQDGDTPLFLACWEANFDFVDLLIKKSADVKVRDKDGSTLLIKIAGLYPEKIFFKILDLFISKGVDVNARDNYGGTAFTALAPHAYVETARWMLENGAEINTRDSSGRTALHYASNLCNEGNIRFVKFLLEKGVDVNAQENEMGLTALDMANAAWNGEGRGCDGIADILKKREVKKQRSFRKS